MQTLTYSDLTAITGLIDTLNEITDDYGHQGDFSLEVRLADSNGSDVGIIEFASQDEGFILQVTA